MTLITFKCDRCGQLVTGIHADGGTAGFYVVDGTGWMNMPEGSGWLKYGRAGEHFVCDACIQSMPEYQSDYPPISRGKT